MKTITLIGLTVLATMAFSGASSAMAETTALCSADPEITAICPAGNLISHVHEESIGKAIILNSSLNIECNVLFLGDTKVKNEKGELVAGSLGNPLHIVGTFTYTNCNSSCTVTEVNGPSDSTVLKLGHELSDVTSKVEVKLECLFFIKCVYNGTALKGHGLGPLLTAGSTSGEVRIEGQEMRRMSGSCPEKAFLDILTTPLVNIYIKA